MGLSFSHLYQALSAPPICFQHALNFPFYNMGSLMALTTEPQVPLGLGLCHIEHHFIAPEHSTGFSSPKMVLKYGWVGESHQSGLELLFSGQAMPSSRKCTSFGVLQTWMPQGLIFLIPKREGNKPIVYHYCELTCVIVYQVPSRVSGTWTHRAK